MRYVFGGPDGDEDAEGVADASEDTGVVDGDGDVVVLVTLSGDGDEVDESGLSFDSAAFFFFIVASISS